MMATNDQAKRRILVTGGSGFIGTHLMTMLEGAGAELLNLDRAPPKLEAQARHWQQLDLADRPAVLAAAARFAPDAIVHLAARTDMDGTALDDYRADNIDATRNLLDAAAAARVGRVVVTSTQYVVRPGILPAGPEHYEPYGAYGESKVETERLVRARADLPCWSIVRPTIVWGPHHPSLPDGLWRYLARGLYLHPGRQPIRRAYVYVGTVAWQIGRILDSPPERVHGEVFYLGEPAVDSLAFMNAFATRLTGRSVKVVPRPIWKALARVGDVANGIGVAFPMSSDRFYRMTTDDVAPVDPTLERLGTPPTRLEDAVNETVAWLRRRWGAGAATMPERAA